MRTGTFLAICSVIGGGIVILLQAIVAYLGLYIPYFDSVIFTLIKLAIVVPIVGLILNPLNQKLRLWRKQRGRDIEEEEKYETESGFIKLTPNDEIKK